MLFTSLSVFSPLHRFVWNQHSDQFPVGLLAQLVEHCTGIAEVMGSNPVQAWIFFRPYFHYCSSSVHYCEDRFHIHVFIRSSNMWLSYIHSHLFTTSWVYLEPTQWPVPSWLVSSVVRALHQYHRGHGFKSHTGLYFFQAFFSLLLK